MTNLWLPKRRKFIYLLSLSLKMFRVKMWIFTRVNNDITLHTLWSESTSDDTSLRYQNAWTIHLGPWAYLEGSAPPSPPPIAPKNCRSTTTKDRLAALLLLQCQAYWIRKPDDSTSFSSVNELKEITEVVLLIDISAAFLSCVLRVHIATGLAKKATPQYSTHNSAS